MHLTSVALTSGGFFLVVFSLPLFSSPLPVMLFLILFLVDHRPALPPIFFLLTTITTPTGPAFFFRPATAIITTRTPPPPSEKDASPRAAHVPGRPPVQGKPALAVVDEAGDGQHGGGAQQDEGDEGPAQAGDGGVGDGEQGGGAGGGVDRVGEGHEGEGKGGGEGAGEPPAVVLIRNGGGEGDADDAGEEVADYGVAGLGERGGEGVELEDGGGALGVERQSATRRRVRSRRDYCGGRGGG